MLFPSQHQHLVVGRQRRAEALLMQPSSLHLVLPKMGDSATFPDEDLLLTFGHDSRWDCDGCPPPSFNLPPPPRPPWLEDVEDCDETSPGIALDQLESCSNHILVDPFGGGGSFEDTFHSVAVIVVCALVLIIVLMIAGVVLFRRRKGLPRHCDTSMNSDTMIPSSVNNVNTVEQLQQQRRQLYYHQLQDSMKRSSTSTARRCMLVRAAAAGATTAQSGGGQFAAAAEGNHYIPDSDKHRLRAVQTMSRLGMMTPQQEFVSLDERSSMPRLQQLQQPPPPQQQQLQQNNYPHILIGGQPFFLIPSDQVENALADEAADSYAYPQSVPIYEEIDRDAVEMEDDCSVASDQGAIGSLRMIRPPMRTGGHNNNSNNLQQHAASPFRPVTSHSQTTNSSELSGSDNSSVHHRSPQQQQQQQHNNGSAARVLVNPLVRDVAFRDPAYAETYEASSNNKEPSKCVKVSHRSPGNGSSSSSSIYYYSDTLRKKPLPSSSSSSCSNSDSGVVSFKTRPELQQKQAAVDTKIVLDGDLEVAKNKKKKDSTRV